MFDVINIVVLQARHVKAAMDKIPAFRPDGLAPADLQAVITTAQGVRTIFLDEQAANLSRRRGHQVLDGFLKPVGHVGGDRSRPAAGRGLLQVDRLAKNDASLTLALRAGEAG